MANIRERAINNLCTTIGGFVAGAVTGAAMSIQRGQITKDALIAGALIGAAGVALKDPVWLKRIKK